jgi:hypothetical protein
MDKSLSDIEDVFVKHSGAKENPILVYILKENFDNNKILILSKNIEKTDIVDQANYEITHINEYCGPLINSILINSKQFNYIFSDVKLQNDNYRFKTYFYLNLTSDAQKNAISFVPYKFIPNKKPHDNYTLQTYVSLENNYNLEIPKKIYDSRHNEGKSKLIWGPSLLNISDDHYIIQSINRVGRNVYNRKTDLINVVVTTDEKSIEKFKEVIHNPLNICIYQENLLNPLNMKNEVYFNWFFDSLRNKIEHSENALYMAQFTFYFLKENIFREKYSLPIDLNNWNEYPNCFPLCFNIKVILEIYNSIKIKNDVTERNGSCYLLRKTCDSHTLKIVDSVKDYFIHPEDSISIDNFRLEENIDVFLKCDKFYCYDNVTFLAVIASACGCTPILIPNYRGFCDIREIYKIYAPWMYYGMAYGDTQEQLEFAKNTRDELFDLLESISKNEYANFFTDSSPDSSILTFLQYLECYFNVSFLED